MDGVSRIALAAIPSTCTKRNDLSLYERYAQDWWNRSSPFSRTLHAITEFRLEQLCKLIPNFAGKSVIDIGCGGGLMSIPLIEAGAVVTGVDLSEASVGVARERARNRGSFIVADARMTLPIDSGSAEVVLLADVLEHVEDYWRILKEAHRLLRTGGTLYVNTINKTYFSYLGVIVLAETFGYIPKGTHDYRLFIDPEILTQEARSIGFQRRELIGESVRWLATFSTNAIHVKRSTSLRTAYSALFTKV